MQKTRWFGVLLCVLVWTQYSIRAWGYGEDKGAYPNVQERINHYLVNRARVDPNPYKGQSDTQTYTTPYRPPYRWHEKLNHVARFQAQHIGGYMGAGKNSGKGCWCSDHSSCCKLGVVNNEVQCTDANWACGATTWGARCQLFGVGCSGENMYSGAGGISSFKAWANSSGHWKNMMGSSTHLGVGIASGSVQNFSGGDRGTFPLFSGMHFKETTASTGQTTTFGIVFYHATEAVAISRVVFANECYAMYRKHGVDDKHGAFETQLILPSTGCQRYVFHAQTTTGQSYTYPSTGSFAFNEDDKSCPFWSAQAVTLPAACQQVPPPCQEGATQPCYPGPATIANVGICKQGTQVCKGGRWGACTGFVAPSNEVCGDNLDNNCNGQVDENPPCECKTQGEKRNCYTGPPNTRSIGICKDGTQTCSNFRWGACSGETKPLATDYCGNSKDDNCDGTVDDGCTGCTDGDKRPCADGAPTNVIGIGECKPGSQTCTGGTWGLCQGIVLPKTEVCNDNKDNNCNGVIDENCTCTKQGETRPCYGGLPKTQGVGPCKAGVQTCNSRWGTCQGQVIPRSEICGNQIDDDCDGVLDNGCATEPTTEVTTEPQKEATTELIAEPPQESADSDASIQESAPSDETTPTDTLPLPDPVATEEDAESQPQDQPSQDNSSSDTTQTTDTTQQDASTNEAPSSDQGVPSAGCGCQTSPASFSWLALCLLLVLFRRRSS